MGLPTIYPTGVTIYNPEKAWNGYTLMPIKGVGPVLFDMNGNIVKVWNGLQGFPNKLLPGGHVMGNLGVRDRAFGYQDHTDLVQVDWEGNVVWKFDHKEFIEDPGREPEWMVRQHHDHQREGNPVGYYAPGMEAKTSSGNTLILTHENVYNKKISDKLLLDDCFIEVDWEGNIIWEWHANEHFREYGFSESAKNVLFRNPNLKYNGREFGDWLHINSMSYLGPNKWYDAGDERFHPDNIIWDSREANICAIISKKTGKVVWKLGPDFRETKEQRLIGQIIGQHHVHMVPKGLPGEGNILIFDNGGWAGYGDPTRTSRDGTKTDIRDTSRVLEIDPVTLKVVWQVVGVDLLPKDVDYDPTDSFRFYSPFVSSAQRLPNGNTLITEGVGSRVFEVTPEKEIVWEFVVPFKSIDDYIYRAYRYPYSYVPQAPTPNETPIERLDVRSFRVPGAASCELKNVVEVLGVKGWPKAVERCAAAAEDDKE
ncbi:MAG: aryl-sulfate sulfotransferase [Dehalobacterium sp.]